MTDNATPTESATTTLATLAREHEPQPAVAAPRRASLLWIGLLMSAFILLTVALLALWQRLDALQTEAARRLAGAEQAATVAKANSEAINTQLRGAEARLAAAEARIADYASQRAALDKLMADATSRESLRISGDFEQLLTLAEQEAQLTINPAPLLTALRVLDGRADLAPTLARDKLKAAISKDTDTLRKADLPDRAALLAKSDELARLLDELPLAAEVKPNTSAEVNTANNMRSNAKRGSDKVPRNTNTPDTSLILADNKSASTSDSLPSIDSWQSWKQWLSALTAPLTDWFKLRRIDAPDALLATPEQQFWLRENMKLQAQSARLSLLARQSDSYQRSLEKVQQTLTQHADAKQLKVQQTQALITQLRAATLNASLPLARETRAALAQLANSPLSYSANSVRELQKR
jgi:uroporphyrin-III C-methyltransferase